MSADSKKVGGEHTPEPWEFRISQYEAEAFDITAERVGALAMVKSAGNARRIVACVNACHGVETIALEQLANSGGIARIFSERAEYSAMSGKLEAQLDKLLAELEKALDSLEYVEQHLPGLAGHGVRQERIASGRAAIAAVKGEYMQLSGRFLRHVELSTDWPLNGKAQEGGAA